jgi:hypothetical protein
LHTAAQLAQTIAQEKRRRAMGPLDQSEFLRGCGKGGYRDNARRRH